MRKLHIIVFLIVSIFSGIYREEIIHLNLIIFLMASIRFFVKTKKDPSSIYIRFYHSKKFDVTVKSGILINPKHWSNKQQGFKNIAETIPNREVITDRIKDFKSHIISEYNVDYFEGEIIDRVWLQKLVDKFNNRPTEGADYETYFIPFAEKWIEESKTRINTDSGKQISVSTIRKYNTTIKRLNEFELMHTTKLKHSDIGLKFHQEFVSFCVDKKYGNSTINKFISQIKMFCREAEAEGCKVNHQYKSRKFSFKREKPLDPYLTVVEIDKIYNIKIEDSRRDAIRDLFIVGLWTGLRVSDFKELNRMNIVGNDIVVASTKKTGVPVTIPIHHQVKNILNKWNGELPVISINGKSLENLFNREIKKITKLAGIVQPILGYKRDKKINRNVRGIYNKNELVSSHICRRSFVSNHYGKIPNQAIMAITGHASEKQLLEYVKLSNQEHIEEVRKYWMEEQLKINN